MSNNLFLQIFYSPTDSPIVIFYVFVMGCLFGSFLNVCIYRLPLNRSIVFPGSACMSCGEPIKWWQNIPILSYFMIWGKCHSCFSPISIRYAFVELLSGCLTLVLFKTFSGFSWPFFYYFVFTCVLIVVFFIDYDHWLILDKVTMPAIALGFLGHFFVMIDPGLIRELFPSLSLDAMPLSLLSSFVGILVGYFVFLAISMIGSAIMKQEAMGGGDIKFAMVLGAFLGVELFFVSFLLSFVIGFAISLPLLFFFKKKGREPLPFGTCMALGAFISLICGRDLMNWFFLFQNWFYDGLLAGLVCGYL